MPTLNIKNVPDELYRRLKERAREHRRSINREAIVCLEGVLCSPPIDVDSFLDSVDRIQEGMNLTPPTEEMLNGAIDEGRP